ncbi:helix-turn-helix transcriptional regulator [Streptomyces californicus]|uniref:Helix-turn-helix transcriptional regulator n=1 Tax=Streptomyces californicus TaxID=67351 RepID=A0ABD7CVQ5_9ACTN|nr:MULTISPECIES: helix-turn-helix domain-containing protein [Streptomyces]QRV29851.1 helix-turn-helix transcriptional regulator [Streptomyces californicus]QRV34540.1 helix-turn-helix transcriptional regulator [Streptomyces californicus]QRV43266.1 helix-turn-helix transcriptional regulator [Streptomyces californicus]QRV49954.1 helix-turn-helix transcriptional regulator [Streptomyces californicus]
MRIVRRPGAFVCGIDAAMDVIGGKWKVLILWALNERTCRFGELRRAVPGVTEKVLSSHLRELEDDGIVHREVYAEVPPRVEYSLTPLGLSLNAALEPLGQWGRDHIYRGTGEAPGQGEAADPGAEAGAGTAGSGSGESAGARTGEGAGAHADAGVPEPVVGLGYGQR